MSKGQNQHVIKSGTGWAVRGAGAEKSSARFKTQTEAIVYAEKIARKEKSRALIHGRDGTIRSANDYGKDPFPPRS